MPLLVVNEHTEALFELKNRALDAPGGGTMKFTGYEMMWRAFDLLFFYASWPVAEIVALALRKQCDPNFVATDLKPQYPLEADIVTKRMVDIWGGPAIDDIALWSFSMDFPGTELDASLNKVVAELYQGIDMRPPLGQGE